MITSETQLALRGTGLDPAAVERFVDAALDEDLAGGVDVTTAATVPTDQHSTLDLVARQPGIVAGLAVAAAVFELAAERGGRAVEIVTARVDGERVVAGDLVLSISGTTADLLTAERSALNLLGHLGGIATATRAWADALAGTRTRVRDTRKTTPLLRSLEKYAVRCGGGVNHRMSLSDAALIKDNHVLAAGGVAAAFQAVRDRYPHLPVEVEVDSLPQLREAIAAGAELVLLDNFDLADMRSAVAIVAAIPAARSIELEASGGLNLTDAASVAATGVDYVAVGALTHSAPTLDIGADLRESAPSGAPET